MLEVPSSNPKPSCKTCPTSAAADSGFVASLQARLARKGASIQASLANPAAAAKLCRWAARNKLYWIQFKNKSEGGTGMIRKSNFPMVISITGLIVVLGIAWGFDTLMRFLNYQKLELFFLNFVIFWLYAFFSLLLAALLLLLAWFVIIQTPRNVWVSLVFLLIGLFIVIYPALYFTPALCCWLPNIDVLLESFTSYILFSGGFIAIIGLLALTLPRGKRMGTK